MTSDKFLTRFLPTKSFIVVCIVSVISALLFAHTYDATTIVRWWSVLLDCTFSGQFSDYQNVLTLADIPNNYPLFLNIAGSICLLPIYIIVNVLHIESLWLYILWVKLLLIVANFGIARAIQIILDKNNISEEKQIAVSLIFLLSPFVQFYSIGMGQIDSFGVLFAMLAFVAQQNEDNVKFIIFTVISVSLKPFAVFIIVPVLIYTWHKNKKLTVITVLATAAWYLLQYFVADLLIDGYSDGSAFWNTFVFMPRLMKWQIAGIPTVIIIIAVVCLYFLVSGYLRKLTIFDVIICQTILLVIFEALVTQHPQWFTYFATVSVMLLAFCNRFKMFYSIYTILEMAFCMCGLVYFDEGFIATSYCEEGLIGKLYTYGGFHVGDFANGIVPHIGLISFIMLTIISIIFVVNVFFMHTHFTDQKEEEQIRRPLLIIISVIPTLILSALAVAAYVA